eukprot:3840851-Rhodomonas_salina.1
MQPSLPPTHATIPEPPPRQDMQSALQPANCCISNPCAHLTDSTGSGCVQEERKKREKRMAEYRAIQVCFAQSLFPPNLHATSEHVAGVEAQSSERER